MLRAVGHAHRVSCPYIVAAVVAEGERRGDLEIVKRPGEIFVYAWPSSIVSVYRGSELVQRFAPPVPDVPPGHTVRSFVDTMFKDGDEHGKDTA